jgi:hypothetical protein
MKKTKMKKLLMFMLLGFTLSSYAQKTANPQPYAKTITAEDLKKHLYIVASKEMGGRETGKEGERKAAAYIEAEMRRIGLEPANNGSYQFPYNVYQDSLVDATIEVNGKAFQLDSDFNPQLSNFAASMRVSEVVLVGATNADTVRNANFAGKVVLLLNSSVPGGGNAINFHAKGAAVVLTVSNVFPRKMPASRKASQSIHLFRKSLPGQQYTISANVAKAIIGNEWENIQKNPPAIQSFPAEVFLQMSKATIALPTSNVMGIIRGTDKPDEYLFITAHHDHIGQRGDSVINYGADDDGSGTVSILELAEAFAKAKKEGKGPRRSIVFMTVSGEEKGLWGSEYYGSHPVFPLDKTTADLNIDMIGRIDPKRTQGDSTNYVYVIGDDKLSSDLRPISEAVNKKYLKMELDYKFNDLKDPNRFYYRSDHYNFAKHGVPIIFYFNGTHADYHRPTDTPDKINYPLMARRAQLVFYTAWEMANRNEMLKRDIPLDTSVFNR